jgi:predicted DNA-binding protein (UPF0251 family)
VAQGNRAAAARSCTLVCVYIFRTLAAVPLTDGGLSTQQAAEIAGVGEAAFKSRLHQARLRVRAAIGDEALIDAGR